MRHPHRTSMRGMCRKRHVLSGRCPHALRVTPTYKRSRYRDSLEDLACNSRRLQPRRNSLARFLKSKIQHTLNRTIFSVVGDSSGLANRIDPPTLGLRQDAKGCSFPPSHKYFEECVLARARTRARVCVCVCCVKRINLQNSTRNNLVTRISLSPSKQIR